MSKPSNVVCDPETGVCRIVDEPVTGTASDSCADHPVVKLLGTTLTGQGNTTAPTASLVGAGKHIGLYFSAHWCGPCRMFTPALAKAYQNFKSSHDLKDNFEIVFVSSDKTQEAFDDYFKDMPWLALPYAERTLKGKLSSKFKVQGIPTFIILDADTGAVVCKDGRSALMSDPEFAEFPWLPKAFHEVVSGQLVDKTGAKVAAKEALDGKVVLLYFSAHWCPPCRGFTPELVKTYNKLKADGKDVEAVFVSSDRDEKSFEEYLSSMPWKAIPFEDKKVKGQLDAMFDVEGIPTLIVLDKDGNVINEEGRMAVAKDPEGVDFPWVPTPPKPLEHLDDDTISVINEGPLVVLGLGGEGVQERAEGILKEFAEEFKKGPDAEDLNFVYGAKSDDIMSKVMEFTGVQKEGDVLMVVSLPTGEKFVAEGGVTKESAEDFLKKFLAGSLEGVTLRD